MYYASFGMLAVVIHLIINYDIMFGPSEADKTEAVRRYRSFLISVVVYYISDILWGILYAQRWRIPAYIDTFMYFVSMVVSLLLWTRFVVVYLDRDDILGKHLSSFGWVIFLFEMIALIVNFFTPVVFSFDENGEYVPGFVRYITLSVQVILFVATGIFAYIYARRNAGKGRNHYLAVSASGFVMTVFIVFQTIFPFLPFYAVGCLIGSCLIHTFVAADARDEFFKKLGTVQALAYRDSLTGVGNTQAYKEAKDNVDRRIHEGTIDHFGVVVFDVNGLKTVNDTYGHDAGDKYIRSACGLICNEFKHSPVFRIGGDEFVALLEGDDYDNRDELLGEFEDRIEENIRTGSVIVSSGLWDYRKGDDKNYDAVFDKADRRMYDRKRTLKDMRGIKDIPNFDEKDN